MLLPNKGLLVLGTIYGMVSVADIITTLVAIRNGARELNPVVSAILHNPIALILLKCIGIALIMYLVRASITSNLIKTHPNVGYFAMALVIGVTSGAVINNIFALKNMGLL